VYYKQATTISTTFVNHLQQTYDLIATSARSTSSSTADEQNSPAKLTKSDSTTYPRA